MASNAVVSMKLDRDAGAAYLRLSTSVVARTIEFSEDIYVDLDALGVVVGVELLDLMTPIPMDALASKHHIHSDPIRILTGVDPVTEQVPIEREPRHVRPAPGRPPGTHTHQARGLGRSSCRHCGREKR